MKKTCTKCGEEKELIEYRIYSGRYRSRCTACELKYQRGYYKNNKEKERQRVKDYSDKNKDKIKKRTKKYLIDNREKIFEQKRKYRATHKKEKAAYEYYYIMGLKAKDLPDGAIELRMKYLALKRRIRELKEAEDGKGKDGAGVGGDHVRAVGQAPNEKRNDRGAKNG